MNKKEEREFKKYFWWGVWLDKPLNPSARKRGEAKNKILKRRTK